MDCLIATTMKTLVTILLAAASLTAAVNAISDDQAFVMASATCAGFADKSSGYVFAVKRANDPEAMSCKDICEDKLLMNKYPRIKNAHCQ